MLRERQAGDSTGPFLMTPDQARLIKGCRVTVIIPVGWRRSWWQRRAADCFCQLKGVIDINKGRRLNEEIKKKGSQFLLFSTLK